ncbi:hypothetical protein EQH57_0218, partial [Dictyocoela roeselum]
CNGLNENVKLEMLKSERTSTEGIYQSIHLVEDILIQKLTTLLSTRTQDIHIQTNNHIQSNYKVSKKHTENKQRQKYCKYHKSKTHDTNECIALAKTKKKMYVRKEDARSKDTEHSHNYGITSLPTTNVLEIPIRVKESQLKAMIDTGAEKN